MGPVATARPGSRTKWGSAGRTPTEVTRIVKWRFEWIIVAFFAQRPSSTLESEVIALKVVTVWTVKSKIVFTVLSESQSSLVLSILSLMVV